MVFGMLPNPKEAADVKAMLQPVWEQVLKKFDSIMESVNEYWELFKVYQPDGGYKWKESFEYGSVKKMADKMFENKVLALKNEPWVKQVIMRITGPTSHYSTYLEFTTKEVCDKYKLTYYELENYQVLIIKDFGRRSLSHLNKMTEILKLNPKYRQRQGGSYEHKE